MVMLKPIKRHPLLKIVEQKQETPKPEEKKTKKQRDLPADVYKDEIEPIDLEIDETRKFVISVKRGGEFGLPMCDVRQYQTTDLYTGFTKKGINFPIELLPDLIELLQVAYGECEEKNLIE